MRLSREARRQRAQIEEACRCSTDDQGIAKFFHVPLYEIMAIRDVMREAEEEQQSADEIACSELKDALLGYYRKWERENGFKRGAGIILVPAGYVPSREMEAA